MGGIGDLLSDVGVNLPEGFGGGIGNIIQGFAFLIILAFVVGIVAWTIFSRKQFNKHIHVFEEVNGQAVPVGEDLAKEIILPNTSIRAIYLKKRKLYLPRPSIQTGRGHYWYFLRKDGEWINVKPSNLNKEMDELKLHYDHTDMRMANASLKKLIEKNYKKINWVKEYAPYIAIGIMILLLAVSSFLITKEQQKLLGGFNKAAEANAESAKALSNVLTGLDNICAGSGIRSVSNVAKT